MTPPLLTHTGLNLTDLTVGYTVRRRRLPVLTDVHAQARRGHVTALLGPNGTGKSTLLRTIAGLQKAHHGSIFLDDQNVEKMPVRVRATHQAIVLTERISPGALTGRELVALGRHPHTGLTGTLSPTDWAIVDEAIHDVHAEHLAGKDLSECSDGERQRIMIARALAQQPTLLLLDEPSAFLDAPSRVALTGLLRKVAITKNIVVVVSTHEVELALRTADIVWLLNRTGDLIDTTPENAALSGLVNSIFDSSDLAFDLESGNFQLTTDPVGTVAITGEHAHVVARLAARQRWAAILPDHNATVSIAPGTVTIHGEAAPNNQTRWVAQSATEPFETDDIDALGAWLQRQTSNPVETQ